MALLRLALCPLLIPSASTSPGVDDESALVQLSHFQDPSKEPGGFTLHSGDIYVGELKCSLANVGIRLKVNDFPGTARVDVFPTSKIDDYQFRWCRPITSCHSGFNVTGTVDPKNNHTYTYQPVAGSNESMQKACTWNAFSFTGFSGGVEAAFFRGNLFERTKMKALYPSGQQDRTAKHCEAAEQAVIHNGMSVDCYGIELDKCTGTRPRLDQGMKVLYLVETFGPENHDEEDGLMSPEAVNRSLSLLEAPYWVDAFGPGATRPIEVIIVAPMARAIETAVIAFGNTGVKIEINPYFIDHRERMPNKLNCLKVLSKFNNRDYMPDSVALDLSLQLDKAFDLLQGNPEAAMGPSWTRYEDVKRKLLDRTEGHFIVICHRNFFRAFNMGWSPAGTIVPFLLKPNFFSDRYDPRCWEDM